MFLTQVLLKNWRSYKNVTFNIPIPDRSGKKNVILIGAQNGVGKTSFLMALYLGLFGREAMTLIEGFRSKGYGEEKSTGYQQLMQSILHRSALETDDPHSSVTLTFSDVENKIISITRRWRFRPGGSIRDIETADGEEVLIEIAGRPKSYANWKEANQKIEEIIFPSNVMSCLFFDGEQAQARVEAAGGYALFEAVKALYGTGLLDQLAESLTHYVRGERSKKKEVGNIKIDELEEKRIELDKKKEELKGVLEKLNISRAAKSELNEVTKNLENNLYELVGDKASDIEEFGKTMSALQTEEAQLRQNLVNGVGNLALPLAMGKYSRKIKDEITSEISLSRWLLLKDEASGKALSIVENVLPINGECNVEPRLLKQQEDKLRELLEKALEALWSPAPEGSASEYKYPILSDQNRNYIINVIDRIGNIEISNLSEIAFNLNRVTTRLSETRVRFEKTKEIQPQLQKFRAELVANAEKQRIITAEIHGHEHLEKGLGIQISDLRNSIGQMEARHTAGTPIQQKIEVAERLKEFVEDAKEKLVPLCKEALEERCTLHFTSMISDEYKNFQAKFDANSEPRLEGPKGQIVTVSSLSGAQKRVFGLSFTLAIADVSKTEAPIVVDTPVGNMDSEYRSRVLKYVAEAAPGQVIFLSHDEEIYGQYVKAINSNILKKFLIVFNKKTDGNGVSTVHDDQYF
jgi:DNA sulfur modification protein DndD